MKDPNEILFWVDILPQILSKVPAEDLCKFRRTCHQADRDVQKHQKSLQRVALHQLFLEATSEDSLLMKIEKKANATSLFEIEFDENDVYITFQKEDHMQTFGKRKRSYTQGGLSLTMFRDEPKDIHFCLEKIVGKASFQHLTLVDVSPDDFEKLAKDIVEGLCPIREIDIQVSQKFDQPDVEYPSLLQLVNNTRCTSFTSLNLTLPEGFWKSHQIKQMTFLDISYCDSPTVTSDVLLQGKAKYFRFDGDTDFTLETFEALFKSWHLGERQIEKMAFFVVHDIPEIADFLEEISILGDKGEHFFYLGRKGDNGHEFLEVSTDDRDNILEITITSDIDAFEVPVKDLLTLPLKYTPAH